MMHVWHEDESQIVQFLSRHGLQPPFAFKLYPIPQMVHPELVHSWHPGEILAHEMQEPLSK